MSARPPFAAEIESPTPLCAVHGRVQIRGWCVDENGRAAVVRLNTPAAVLAQTSRTSRADVAATLGLASGRDTGFCIEGLHPAGVYIATVDAKSSDGAWHVLKTLSIVVESAPPTVVIEKPVSDGCVSESRRISGWAAHRDHALQEISLRYGNQNIETQYGLPRSDVETLFPEAFHIRECGFESVRNLPAGRGPLRVRVRFGNGSIAVIPTPLVIAIATDENGGTAPPANLERVGLGGYGSRAVAAPTPAAVRRNILFVLYGDFTSNSALQVCALANELAWAGHDCVVAVPRDVGTIKHQPGARFRAISHADAIESRGAFSNGRGPDLVHAWTTREIVRATAGEICRRHGGRMIVQLEDNEQQILAQSLGRKWDELIQLDESELNRIVPAELSHPIRSRQFLAAADGVTVIVEKLREFVPCNKPCATIWPAADARYFYPREKPMAFREALGFSAAHTVLFYHGNVHAANAAEMRELYIAVALLNESGHACTLIRAGRDDFDFLGNEAGRARPHVLELGQILNHRHLPPLMAIADVFVQPGAPDAFNDYRLPSKLPEFFSIGRPVVIPRTNVGEHAVHGRDAFVLPRADAGSIAAAIREIRSSAELEAQLSSGAIAFAEKNFDWRHSAQALANFYASVAAS